MVKKLLDGRKRCSPGHGYDEKINSCELFLVL